MSYYYYQFEWEKDETWIWSFNNKYIYSIENITLLKSHCISCLIWSLLTDRNLKFSLSKYEHHRIQSSNSFLSSHSRLIKIWLARIRRYDRSNLSKRTTGKFVIDALLAILGTSFLHFLFSQFCFYDHSWRLKMKRCRIYKMTLS